MSETVIFAPKKIEAKDAGVNHQLGVSFQANAFDAETMYPDLEGRVRIPNEFGGYGTLFMNNGEEPFAAVSVSAGSGVGVDATVKIIEPVYMTAAYSFADQFAISLPVRIYYTEKIGWFAAPILRKRAFFYHDPENDYKFSFFSNTEIDYHSTVGIKSGTYLFTPAIRDGNRRLYYGVKLEGGAVLGFETWYFSIGFRLGGY